MMVFFYDRVGNILGKREIYVGYRTLSMTMNLVYDHECFFISIFLKVIKSHKYMVKGFECLDKRSCCNDENIDISITFPIAAVFA